MVLAEVKRLAEVIHLENQKGRLPSHFWCLGSPPRRLFLSAWLAWVSFQHGNLMQKSSYVQPPKVSIARGTKVEAANLLQPVLESYRVTSADQSTFYRSKLVATRRHRLPGGERDPTSKEGVAKNLPPIIFNPPQKPFHILFSLCLTISCEEGLVTTQEQFVYRQLRQKIPLHHTTRVRDLMSLTDATLISPSRDSQTSLAFPRLPKMQTYISNQDYYCTKV